MDKKLKELRRISKVTTPRIIIGKKGPTDQVISNIKKELKEKNFVKVKILKTYIDEHGKDETFTEIVEKTGSKIVQTIGFTISLTRK